MNNAKISVKGSKVDVHVDMTKEIGLSSTGKTVLIATGREEIPGFNPPRFVSINCYRYLRANEKIAKKTNKK